MSALKRFAVWSMEVLVGALLLGALFGALSSPDVSTFISILPGVWAAAFGVSTFLFLHGYYFTTAFFGVVWRSRKFWVYPATAAALFLIHTHIIFMRLKPDLSSSGKAAELPFLAGGASIVFICAVAGNWCLRKWGVGGSPSGEAHSPNGVSVTGG